MYFVNVDWMQVFCKGEFIAPYYVTFKNSEYGTKNFESFITCYLQGEEYAIILSKPRSGIISPQAVIVKLLNCQLYKDKTFTHFDQFLKDSGLTFVNFTRIDVCADFEVFDNNMSANNFIMNFVNNKYLKTKKSTYTIRGNQINEHVYDYLRIGSANSSLSGYLYNKSKEMRDIKMKSYIWEHWLVNGLNVEKDIYRLEFTLKNFKMKYIDESGSDYSKFNIVNFDELSFKVNLYHSLLNTGWKFKHNDGTVNKSRMRDVVFFKKAVNAQQISFDTDKMNNSRYTKGVINFLEQVNSEVRQTREEERTKFSRIAEDLATLTNLENWYNNVHVNKLKDSNDNCTD